MRAALTRHRHRLIDVVHQIELVDAPPTPESVGFRPWPHVFGAILMNEVDQLGIGSGAADMRADGRVIFVGVVA